MGFLKKLFGGSTNSATEGKRAKDPDNTRLISLMNIHGQHPSKENYKQVLDEITTGNCCLLVPSANNDFNSNGWKTLAAGTTISLASVYNLDGLQVLGVFTDETSLIEWTKRSTEYTAVKAQDLLDFCKQNGIDRIVINSDQKNMFVLERNRENITSKTLEEETKVLVGTAARPLPREAIELLTQNFRKVHTIEEAYQYAQTMNGETSLVLAVKMSIVSENSRAALYNALNNSLKGVDVGMPIDIMVMENEGWLNTVRNISNSLFYSREAVEEK